MILYLRLARRGVTKKNLKNAAKKFYMHFYYDFIRWTMIWGEGVEIWYPRPGYGNDVQYMTRIILFFLRSKYTPLSLVFAL